MKLMNNYLGVKFKAVTSVLETFREIFELSSMNPWFIPSICILMACSEIGFIAVLSFFAGADYRQFSLSDSEVLSISCLIIFGRVLLNIGASYALARFTMNGLRRFRMKKFSLLYTEQSDGFDRGFWLDAFGRRSNQLFQVYILQAAKAMVELVVVGSIIVYVIVESSNAFYSYIWLSVLFFAVCFAFVVIKSRELGVKVANASKDILLSASKLYEGREEIKVNRLTDWAEALQERSVEEYSKYQAYYLGAQSVPKPLIEAVIFFVVVSLSLMSQDIEGDLITSVVPILFLGLRAATLFSILSRLALQFGFASPSLSFVKM